MRLKHSMRFKQGFMPIVEAVEGHYLLGGRVVQDGPVFERFCDALYCMNAWIRLNQESGRFVRVARVEPFEGMVSVLTPQ
jgi:hypothetical protein